jgi:hypothetical protein
MPGIPYDLNYAAAGLSELKAYLLSKELFWPLSLKPSTGKPSVPKLTPGNLLLSFARLEGYRQGKKMDAGQENELLQLERDFDVLRSKWAVAWEKKVRRAFTSRLRQWGLYLNEIASDANTHAPYFATEVRLRVLLELLQEELEDDIETDLTVLDGGLRAYFTPGDFIWDTDLAEGFPQEKYWYLWGKPINKTLL